MVDVRTRDRIDHVKGRAALTGFAGTGAVAFGLVRHPIELIDTVGGIASSALHGNMVAMGDGLRHLVHHAFHPDGVADAVFKGAMGLQGVAYGAVGGLELYHGLRQHDAFVASMGTADLIGSLSSFMVVANAPVAAVTTSILASACMATLVATHPTRYSRVQKVATFCDAAESTATICMMSGVAVLPAMAASFALSVAGALYLNHQGFRRRANAALDRLISRRYPSGAALT
ncbi:MAG: hypothetical protein ACYCW6_14425 [Candidatus Xenobia bacterium]